MKIPRDLKPGDKLHTKCGEVAIVERDNRKDPNGSPYIDDGLICARTESGVDVLYNIYGSEILGCTGPIVRIERVTSKRKNTAKRKQPARPAKDNSDAVFLRDTMGPIHHNATRHVVVSLSVYAQRRILKIIKRLNGGKAVRS